MVPRYPLLPLGSLSLSNPEIIKITGILLRRSQQQPTTPLIGGKWIYPELHLLKTRDKLWFSRVISQLQVRGLRSSLVGFVFFLNGLYHGKSP